MATTHVKITKAQAVQFNQMRDALQRIKKAYCTPEQLRRQTDKSQYGPDYVETLEMAYENLQTEAEQGVKGVKELKF